MINIKIAIYTAMSTTTDNTSVHGVSMFMFPLIKKLKQNGYKITYCGKVVLNKQKNIFCDLLKLKPYILDISEDMDFSWDISDSDVLLIYNRPPEQIAEFEVQNAYIKKAIELKIPILFIDGDLWGRFLPDDLIKEVILLRPYSSIVYDNLFKKAYHFEYFTHNPEEFGYTFENREKIIDYCYLGNMYNRFIEFKEKVSKLNGNIVVGGGWLKNAEYAAKSSEIKNVLFIGEVPHCFALPLLAISKKTFYVVPKNYSDVGMKTSRIYEAKISNCEIDVDTSNLNTLDKAYKLFMKIIKENE